MKNGDERFGVQVVQMWHRHGATERAQPLLRKRVAHTAVPQMGRMGVEDPATFFNSLLVSSARDLS